MGDAMNPLNPNQILRILENGYFMTHQEQAEAAQYIRQLQQENLTLLGKTEIPMTPEHLPQYIATNNIKPTTEGGGGAGGELAKPEPVAHAVIAGVLFDFMGWLTSRQERLVLSSCDDASPAVKVIQEFAIMRGLSLDDARVKDWQDMTSPTRKEWVGLTDEEKTEIFMQAEFNDLTERQMYDVVEAKLKEKNGG